MHNTLNYPSNAYFRVDNTLTHITNAINALEIKPYSQLLVSILV